MSVQASAGIEFAGRSIRYAQVQPTGNGFRLLRLGQCDFDFEVVDTLLGRDAAAGVDSMRQALEEALGDTRSTALRVALHPPLCRSFFSAAPASGDLSPVAYEAGLLGFVPEDATDGVAFDIATSESGRERLHVTAIDPKILEHLSTVVDGLDAGDAQAVSSIRAVAEIVRLLRVSDRDAEGYTVAIGCYDGLVEMAVLGSYGWQFAEHLSGPTVLSDASFHIAAALDRLQIAPGAVHSVLRYGAAELERAATDLGHVFGATSMALNPLELLDFDADSLDPDYTAAWFAPALGAAML